MTTLLPLAQAGAESPARVGGKAASLGRLKAAGFPVPDGFVVASEAWAAHLARPEIQEALAAARRPGADRRERLARARQAIEGLELDPALERDLEQALGRLGPGPLAVRSSAAAEDSATRSFAGLHDTVLGVQGLAECAGALRRCWASAFSERAVEYRERAGLGEAAAAMAVVVQSLVPASWAGVLFTRDPTGQAGDELVCEAVEGLGEALVSGRATPSRWTLSRERLEITSRHEEGGGGGALAEEAVRQIARTGLAIERAFGGAPQDVEWALAGGELRVLQARPITTALAAGAGSREDRIVWSNTNLGELLPGVLTPLSWSIARRFVDDLLRSLVERLGLDLRRLPLLGLVAGRAYVNMNSVAALLRRVPGMRGKSYADFFGGDQAALVEAMGRLTEADLPQTEARAWRVALHLPGFVLWLLRLSDLKLPKWMDEFRGFRPPSAAELRALPDERLAGLAEETMFFFAAEGRSEAIGFGFVAVAAMGQVGALARRWLGDADGAMGNRLLSGVGGIDSAEAGLDLWRLADAARASGLREAIEGAKDFAALLEAVAAAEPGRLWLEAWNRFVGRHGHHARSEMDPASARWREQPDYLLGMVRNYLTAPPEASPVALHERMRAEREALQREILGRLGWLKRKAFAWVLDRAQRGMVIREGAKSEMARRAALVRELAGECGRRLVERGLLEAGEDAFFVSMEEQPDALAGRIPGLAELVKRRKAEHAANRAVAPPAVVVGRFDPRRHLLPPPPATRVLKGVSVSPGVAEGPARVLLTADSPERVLPGEILVAPFTDPGWTPYFLPAAAIVMDMGGVLSHGAVLAREYGIPAVVNVGPATRIIRTGQRIRVDALRGEVQVLD